MLNYKLIIRSISLTFIFFITSLSFADTKGDNAVFSLSFANLLCAGVSHVNPDAVSGGSELYLNRSIKLYKLYHGNSHEEAKLHQKNSFKLITSERAIKAQSLNSIAGAKRYVKDALSKTDASKCEELGAVSRKLLSKYGIRLD